jgi:superfamily II DNA or RNA helicase
MDVTEPQALRSLKILEKVETKLISPTDAGFHSKAYLFGTAAGEQRAWVGSSNLTKGGISTNLEWNLSTRDSATCREATDLFESLWVSSSSRPLTDADIDAYELVRRERIASGFVPREQDGAGFLSRTGEPPPSLIIANDLQSEALAGLRRMRADGAKRALVIAATGVGKTFLAAFDAQAVRAKKVLFVAHRKDILVQAEAAFRKVLGFSQSNSCLLFENEPVGEQDYLFASVPSLANLAKRGHKLLRTKFDYVIVDEFHHADARSWRAVLNAIDAKFLLGLTATPERADGRDILELCDFNVAYEVRLSQAIERKVLIPFHYFGIPDDGFTEEKVPWKNGRFDPEALEKELQLPERVENLLENATEKGFDGAKRIALGFCQSHKHAKYMAAEFLKRGVGASVLVGEDDREIRDAVYARLQNPNDPLQWLFVVDLLNEGVDLPAINVIAMLRPTESMPLFLQQLGRGLRKFPGTEVLTVLDFVGHHRKAFVPLEALSDPAGVMANSDPTTRELCISAPPFCEFLLEDRTIAILKTIKERTKTRKDKAREAYLRVKAELGRAPRPIDFWGNLELPSFAEIRNAFGSWSNARSVMGDAFPWEHDLIDKTPLESLVSKSEGNWQQGRVTAYAALWAATQAGRSLLAGYNEFFTAHPQWNVERDALATEELLQDKLVSELPEGCRSSKGFVTAITKALRDETIGQGIRERLLPTLAEDYRTRHGGVLRSPEALRLFSTYSRPEAVNHFGVQYDPMRHNTGFFEVAPNQFVIITKLDTSGAKKEFQYSNALKADLARFEWSSQNRQRRDNEAGKAVTEQKRRGTRIFLFVQPRSHAKAVFLGEVVFETARGDAPMTVLFRLPERVPRHVAEQVGLL